MEFHEVFPRVSWKSRAALLSAALLFSNSAWAAGTTGADFLRLEVPARSSALAAGVAGLGGSEALNLNPAGLLGQGDPSVSFTHFASFADTAYEQFEGLLPAGAAGHFAARVFFASTADFTEFDANGDPAGSLANYDLLLHAGYAFLYGQHLVLGAGLKIFQSTLADLHSEGAALDLGLQYPVPGTDLRLGLSLQNLGAMTAFESESDPLPLMVNAGLAYTLIPWDLHAARLFADVLQPLAGDEATSFSFGGEYGFAGLLFVRGGYRLTGELGNLSLGAGLHAAGFGVDYAYQPLSDLGNNHRLTFSYFFLPPGKAAAQLKPVTPVSLAEKDLAAARQDVAELTALPHQFTSHVALLPAQSPETAWTLTVRTSGGLVHRVLRGTGAPREIAWDGKDEQGHSLSGETTYQLVLERGGRTPEIFSLPCLAPALKLRYADKTTLDPEVCFRFREIPETTNWTISVWEAGSQNLAARDGQNGGLPAEWVWDGKDRSGRIVDSGKQYQFGLELTYAGGAKVRLRGEILPIEVRSDESGQGFRSIRVPGILFDLNRAELKPEMTDKILAAADLLLRYGNKSQAVIEGHADETGTEQYNQVLSETRAQMVRNFMLKQAALDSARITWKGFGKSRPDNPGTSDAARAQNRRVEIRVIVPAQ